MTWEKLKDVVETFTKAQIHALVVLFLGATLALLGRHDEGNLVLGGGLAMLRAHNGQPGS